MFAVSCKMDFEPVSTLPSESAIKSAADATKAANYFNIRLRGLYSGEFIYAGELSTDLFHAMAGFGNRGGDLYRWEMTSQSSYAENLWSNCYFSLADANYFIEKVEGLDKTSMTDSEIASLENYIGQAAFLKAASVYALMEKFAPVYNASTASTDLGVMLVDSYNPTSDQTQYPGRSSVAECYKFIEDNIAIALSKITNPNKLASELITTDAVKAFKARVALSKGDWATAASCASSLIDSGLYPLIDASGDKAEKEWTNLWTNDSGAECIVQLYAKFEDQSVPSTLTYGYYGYNTSGTYQPDFVPETHILDLYSDTDIRCNWFEYVTATENSITGDVVVFNKFPGNPALQSPTASISDYLQKVKPFRIAEQYLIAAEAYARSNDDTNAAKYFNAFCKMRDPEVAETRATGDALIKAIRDERLKELIGEGFRFYDLKRYGEGFTRSELQNPEISTTRGSDLSIAASAYGWLWPIPQAEIDSNPQIKNQQNPGYTTGK